MRVRPAGTRRYYFPTQTENGDAWNTALFAGELVERSGCLFLESKDGERWLALWPDGYRLIADGQRLDVVNGLGQVVGSVGHAIRVGGGERNPVAMGGVANVRRHVLQLIGEHVPDRCDASLYWVVSPTDVPD